MPQSAWSPKRERQYEHIKEGLLEHGSGEDKADEIAARTVNKERARHGETKQVSRTSIDDISSGRRAACGPTRDQAEGLTTSSATRPGSAASKADRGCGKPSWKKS
jgi:hypothetical protein